MSSSCLADQLRSAASAWGRRQRDLVKLSARFADGNDWILDGSPSAAHWVADVAQVEVCTGREWIRIGRLLRNLPEMSAAFDVGHLSYAKVRTLTREATPDNEHELLALALSVPAGELTREIAKWLTRTQDPEELAARHHRRRSIVRRQEPDGMLFFGVRVPPMLGGTFERALEAIIMSGGTDAARGSGASAGERPTLLQQRADALQVLLDGGGGATTTEVVLHVRGDGCTLDDGTPVPETIVPEVLPEAFVRALIHDAEGRPVNASSRRRTPTVRQKRVVRERDRVCVDCGTSHFLQYDHVPPYDDTKHTVTDELELRCSGCHGRRHAS